MMDSLPLYLYDHAPLDMELVEATLASDLEHVNIGDIKLNYFFFTNKLNTKNIIFGEVRLGMLLCFKSS